MNPDIEQAFFDTYVEVETERAEEFWWSVEIWLRLDSWTLDREVSRPGTDGPIEVITFEEVAFERFSDLAERLPSLVDELFETARTFNFAR